MGWGPGLGQKFFRRRRRRSRRRAAACGAAVRGYFIFHIPLTPISFAKLLNEFRSYFLLALLNYLMNLFLGGAISY